MIHHQIRIGEVERSYFANTVTTISNTFYDGDHTTNTCLCVCVCLCVRDLLLEVSFRTNHSRIKIGVRGLQCMSEGMRTEGALITGYCVIVAECPVTKT